MSNFQIHELSTGALDRDSNIVHDSEVSGAYQTRKATAGAVADLALEVVASEYDDTASYAIGSYCIYSGVLYRCTTATTGTFDVSDWTAVLITGEYKRVRVMHKADFDLLTPEEQADGMIFVDDVDITASDISYDNTSSGLSASDLQEAVDEIADRAYLHEDYSNSQSVANNTAVQLTNPTITVPESGLYLAVGYVSWAGAGSGASASIRSIRINNATDGNQEYISLEASTTAMRMQTTWISNFTKNAVLSLGVRQASGSSLNVDSCSLDLYRLK